MIHRLRPTALTVWGLLWLVTTPLWLGCGGETAAPPRPEGTPPNVLFLVVDTLRADHVGAYGGSVATPHLDELAASGVLFERGYSHIPVTGPSHTSMFSGLLPSDHKVEINAQLVPEELDLLAERLKAAGYDTAAFVSLGVLKADWGFSQGFDSYDDKFGLQWFRRGDEITDAALAWADEADPSKPYLAWVHYSDPHEPYSPPGADYPEIRAIYDDEVVATFRADGSGQQIDLKLPPGTSRVRFERDPGNTRWQIIFRAFNVASQANLSLGPGWIAAEGESAQGTRPTKLPAELVLENPGGTSRNVPLKFITHEELDLAAIQDAYRREVAYADEQIGRLLDGLDERGLLADTLIVLTSDHGEGLGDHDLVGHIEQVYDSLIHVPLIVRGPGLEGGRKVSAPVRHVDLMPTILDLVGLEPPTGIRGQTLGPVLRGEANVTRRPVVAMTFPPTAQHHREALLLRDQKYIRTEETGTQELYNLSRDPEELQDLSAEATEQVEQMDGLLTFEIDLFDGQQVDNAEAADLTQEEKDQLRALGYIQ